MQSSIRTNTLAVVVAVAAFELCAVLTLYADNIYLNSLLYRFHVGKNENDRVGLNSYCQIINRGNEKGSAVFMRLCLIPS